MKFRRLGLFLLPLLFWMNTFVPAQVSEKEIRQIPVQRVTLFSRIKYQEKDRGYGKSAFNFHHGVRSDGAEKATGNDYDLLYGNISLNGDTDWFLVSMVTDDRSRIKDLGELEWSEVFDVPVLLARPEPGGGIRMAGPGQAVEETSDGMVTRVAVGHVYVVHTKDSVSDYYAMFRVEELVPSDRCVISWKRVPSPEK